MIVTCTCGQKNRIKPGLATGAITAKAINCGSCKTSLVNAMTEQVELNSRIVMAILELADDEDVAEEGPKKFVEGVVNIFSEQGLDLIMDKSDDEDDEEGDDDADEVEDEDEDEEPTPKKKKVVKKKSSKKRSH